MKLRKILFLNSLPFKKSPKNEKNKKNDDDKFTIIYIFHIKNYKKQNKIFSKKKNKKITY